MFLWGRLATRGSGLCLRSNVSVGIESADGAIAFDENAAALFDERLDLVDELFLIELFFRRAVGFVDMLDGRDSGQEDELELTTRDSLHTYLSYSLANRLHLRNGVLEDTTDLLRNLSLLLFLQLLGSRLRSFLLLWYILQ